MIKAQIKDLEHYLYEDIDPFVEKSIESYNIGCR
jgi:hypothetical protein